MFLGAFKHINEFLSDYHEWHVLVIGACEVLCPWRPRHEQLSDELKEQMKTNYHYYVLGRFVGVVGWVVIAKIVQVIFW